MESVAVTSSTRILWLSSNAATGSCFLLSFGGEICFSYCENVKKNCVMICAFVLLIENEFTSR